MTCRSQRCRAIHIIILSACSTSTAAPSEDTSLASAGSTARPTSTQLVETQLQAAVAEVPASAGSLLAAAQAAVAQPPSKASQDDSARAAAETVLAMAAGSKTFDAPKTEEANTQLEALPVLEAKAGDEATLAGAVRSSLPVLCLIQCQSCKYAFV